jgi:hypothetical protein
MEMRATSGAIGRGLERLEESDGEGAKDIGDEETGCPGGFPESGLDDFACEQVSKWRRWEWIRE